MNKFLKSVVFGTMIAVGCAAAAADSPDPVAGTWNLNLAKSTFKSGPAPKSQTRIYTQTSQGTVLKFTGVAANGSAISGQSTLTYDGKDCAITGSPDYDTLSLKRVNGTTVKSSMKRGGKVVGSTTRSISEHGKVLALATKLNGADGKPVDTVMVFDKQ